MTLERAKLTQIKIIRVSILEQDLQLDHGDEIVLEQRFGNLSADLQLLEGARITLIELQEDGELKGGDGEDVFGGEVIRADVGF